MQPVLPVLFDVAFKSLTILLLATIGTAAMRRSSAAARHLVWFVSIMAVLTLPVLSFFLPSMAVLPMPALGEAAEPIAVTQYGAYDSRAPLTEGVATPQQYASKEYLEITDDTLSPANSLYAPSKQASDPVADGDRNTAATTNVDFASATTWWQHGIAWLPWIWLGGAVFALLPVGLGWLSLWHLKRTTQQIVSGSWQILLGQLAAEIGLKRSVILLKSPCRTMPMTWGIFPWRKAAVLIPEDASEWSPERRRAVLLHELAHIKRHDCLTQVLTQLACALYWFNPLVWFAAHRMLIERERACDDLVLLHETKPSDYAQHLLDIATGPQANFFAAHAGIAMARRSKLDGRVVAILDKHRNRKAMTRLGVAITITLLGAIAVPIAMLRADIVNHIKNFDFQNPPDGYERGIRAADRNYAITAGDLIFQLSKLERTEGGAIEASLGIDAGYEVVEFRLFDHATRELFHTDKWQSPHDGPMEFVVHRIGESDRIQIEETGGTLPSQIDLWMRIVENGEGDRIRILAQPDATATVGGAEIVVVDLLPGMLSGSGDRDGRLRWDLGSAHGEGRATTIQMENRGDVLRGRYHLVAVSHDGRRHPMDHTHFLQFEGGLHEAPSRFQYEVMDLPPADIAHLELVPFKSRHKFFFNGVTVPERFAERFARGVTDAIEKRQVSFLNQQQYRNLGAELVAFIDRYDKGMLADEDRDQILSRLPAHLSEQFGEPGQQADLYDREQQYLSMPDWLQTLQWKLWLAMRREPLTDEQRTRLQEQFQWLRQQISDARSLGPSHSVQQAAERLEQMREDPLVPLFKAPLNEEQWQRVRDNVEQEMERDRHAFSLLNRIAFLWLAAPYEGGEDFDLSDIPYDDRVYRWGMSGRSVSLGFQSNATHYGNQLSFGAPSHSVYDVIKMTLESGPRDATVDELLVWLARHDRRSDVMIFDDNGPVLRAVRQARIVRLNVTNWFEADGISDAQLRQKIETQGAESLPVLHGQADVNGWPFNSNMFVAVRTKEGHLSVLRVLNVHRTDDGALTGEVHIRPRPLLDPVTGGFKGVEQTVTTFRSVVEQQGSSSNIDESKAQVQFDISVILLPMNVLAQEGIHLPEKSDVPTKKNESIDGDAIPLTLIDDLQVDLLHRLGRDAALSGAVVFFNARQWAGETASLLNVQYEDYIAGYHTEHVDGQRRQVPDLKTAESGVAFDLVGHIKKENKSIELTLRPKLSTITGPTRKLDYEPSTSDKPLQIEEPQRAVWSSEVVAAIPQRSTLLLVGPILRGKLDRNEPGEAAEITRRLLILVRPTALGSLPPRDLPTQPTAQRMKHVREALLQIHVYVNEHNQWPETMEVIRAHLDDANWLDEFEYRRPETDPKQTDLPQHQLLVETEPLLKGQRIVGFADGHVEVVEEDEEPASSKALPNDANATVVAIGRGSADGVRWFLPDGTPLSQPPLSEKLELRRIGNVPREKLAPHGQLLLLTRTQSLAGGEGYRSQVRLKPRPDRTYRAEPTNVEHIWELSDQSYRGHLGVLHAYGFEQVPEKLTVQIRIADNQWQEVGAWQRDDDASGNITVDRIAERDDHTEVFITHPPINRETNAVRALAESAQGEALHASIVVGGRTSSRVLLVPDTDPDQIQQLVLEVQPWQVATFEDLPTSPVEGKQPVDPFEHPELLGVELPQTEPADDAAFPLIERTVRDDNAVGQMFIDLDTGQLVTPPEDLYKTDTEAVNRWMKAFGVDAMGETSSSVRGLVGFDMVAIPIDSAQWGRLSAAGLRKNDGLRRATPGSPVFLSAKGDLPATYLFRTREGAVGILQITGFAEEPRGIHVRYRATTQNHDASPDGEMEDHEQADTDQQDDAQRDDPDQSHLQFRIAPLTNTMRSEQKRPAFDSPELTTAQRQRVKELLPRLHVERNWQPAAEELVGMGPAVAPELLPLLDQGGTDTPAFHVLKGLAREPSVQRLMLAILDQPPRRVIGRRHNALLVLGEAGDAQHVPRILEALKQAAAMDPRIAAGEIGPLAALSAIGGDAGYEALAEALEIVSPDMLWVAVEHLAHTQQPEALPHLYNTLRRIGWRHMNNTFQRVANAIRKLEQQSGRPVTPRENLYTIVREAAVVRNATVEGAATAHFSADFKGNFQDMGPHATMLYDLDTGQRLELMQHEWNGRVDEWARANGLDLEVQVQDEVTTVVAIGTKLVALEADDWNRLTPQRLGELVAGSMPEERIVHRLDPRPTIGAPFAFRTREGAIGIFRITRWIDNAPGMEIELRILLRDLQQTNAQRDFSRMRRLDAVRTQTSAWGKPVEGLRIRWLDPLEDEPLTLRIELENASNKQVIWQAVSGIGASLGLRSAGSGDAWLLPEFSVSPESKGKPVVGMARLVEYQLESGERLMLNLLMPERWRDQRPLSLEAHRSHL